MGIFEKSFFCQSQKLFTYTQVLSISPLNKVYTLGYKIYDVPAKTCK